MSCIEVGVQQKKGAVSSSYSLRGDGHWRVSPLGMEGWTQYESSIARGAHCYSLRAPSSEGVLSNGHNVPV